MCRFSLDVVSKVSADGVIIRKVYRLSGTPPRRLGEFGRDRSNSSGVSRGPNLESSTVSGEGCRTLVLRRLDRPLKGDSLFTFANRRVTTAKPPLTLSHFYVPSTFLFWPLPLLHSFFLRSVCPCLSLCVSSLTLLLTSTSTCLPGTSF